jgi:uncharacterized membrane protein YhaH (DUF805 family)
LGRVSHAIFVAASTKLRGTELRDLFFSLRGRLGRLGFLLRGMALGITTGVLFVVGFTLFLHGALWWLGLLIAIIAVATLLVCYASLVVRRLHDMNFSGYHAIWVVPVEIFGVLVPAALTSEGVDTSRFDDAVFTLIAVIGAFLLLWPGTKRENRFGDRPNRRGFISSIVLARE